MLINVPQYINVEDKVAGPLTAKQLGWLIAMGIILFLLWIMLPKAAFFVAAVPVALFAIALAFYKPYGQPLGNFLIFGILYYFKPKVYIWQRSSQVLHVPQRAPQKKAPEIKAVKNRTVTGGQISALAHLLDSGGSRYDKEVADILKAQDKSAR